jgi:hypothetical protein
MTWLEPMWLAYPTAALLVLTILFALSVRWTLKAHPVPVLNYAYEPVYARTYRPATPTNYHQGFSAMTATSAVAFVHEMTREQIMRRRAMEDALWGDLPSVERYA